MKAVPEIRRLANRTVIDFGAIWFVVPKEGPMTVKETVIEPGEEFGTVRTRRPTRREVAKVKEALSQSGAKPAN